MVRLRQSFAWWCFAGRGVDDATLLREAKVIGYDAVELIPADKFGMAADAGLKIASSGGHASIESGLNDLSNHDRIEKEIDENLAIAVKYGIPNLIVFTGNRRTGLSDSQGIENAAAGLRRVASAAKSAGITLVIELLNSRVDHPKYMGDKTDIIVEIVKAVESPFVKLLYDIYHAQVMEGDIIRTISSSNEYIGHYHTAGCPGRRDLDEDQELYYPAIFKAISATRYTGFITHEFLPLTDPVKALTAAFELTQSSVVRQDNL